MNNNIPKSTKTAAHHLGSHALALRVVSVAVASCFSATAFAAGTGGHFVRGTGTIVTKGNLQTITNSPSAIINWNSLSSGVNETIRFNQQNAQSAVLNRVVGLDPTVLLGTLSSNGRVFIINPNGILFGASSVVDVNGLVASTLNISDDDFIAGKLNFTDNGTTASVVNQGFIRTATGGGVYLVAPDVTNSGIIKSAGGEVILAAGHSVQLIDAGTPELQVQISAGGNAVNVGSIIAHSGDIGIYGALITQGGKLDADSATVGEGGSIILSASQDIDMQAGGVTTASGGSGNNNAGNIQIIADGTLNVAQGHEIHVDGGQQGGNAGTLEVSGKTNIHLDGEMTGVAVRGYEGGSLLVDPQDILITTSAGAPALPGTPFITASSGFSSSAALKIDPTALKTWADTNGWLTVALKAHDDILVNAAIGTAASRFNHNLTMTAGDQMDINADIFLGTTKTLDLKAGSDMGIAPFGATTTAVTVDAGSIKLTAGNGLLIGGTGAQAKTNIVAATNIVASATNLTLRAGNVTAGNGDNKDATINVTAGGDINLQATNIINLQAGNVTANAIGAGANTATATANLNLKAGGNFTLNAGNDLLIFAGLASANANTQNNAGNAANTAKAEASVSITAGKLFTATAGNASNTGSLNIQAGNANANAAKTGNGGIVSTTGNQSATATANLTITAGTGIAIAAVDSNATGTSNVAQVNLRTQFVSAQIQQNANNSGNNLVGNATATATGNLTLKTTAGNLTLSATGGDDGGNIEVTQANATTLIYNTADGSSNVVTGNNTASAQGTTSLTAGADINFTANNVAVVTERAYATLTQNIQGDSNAITGAQKATSVSGISITGGGDVNMTATNGGVVIVADNAAIAHIDQAASGSASSGKLTTTGNLASATETISIKAGGDLNITGSNVGVYGYFASADVLQKVFQTGGDKLSGNQSATATNTITLTATGNIALTATNDDISIYANNAVGHFGSFGSSHTSNHPNITRARVMQGGSSNGSNTLTGNLSATATGGITFTAGKDVSMQGNDVNVYNNAASASAVKSLIFADDDILSGNHSATATSNINITGGGNISMRGANNGDVSIGNRYAYTSYFSGTSHGPSSTSLRGASAKAGQSTAPPTDSNKFSGNQTANATTNITLKAGTVGSVVIKGGNVSIRGADIQASAFNQASGTGPVGSINTVTGNNIANATNAVSITAGKDISIAATNTFASSSAGQLHIDGGKAEAIAYNKANGGAGHSAIGTNTATANSTLTLAAGGAISLTAINDVHMSADSAEASAYNAALGNINTVTGANTAKANSALTLTATAGGISVGATGNNGSISIIAYNGDARAYAQANGNANKLSGNQSASAIDAVKFNAGTGITLNANHNVNVAAHAAEGLAFNSVASGYDNGNTITGNHTADGRSTIDLLAKGAVSITAQNSRVTVAFDGGSAQASAYNMLRSQISGTGPDNTITGNHSANAQNSVTLTGSAINISGQGVGVSSGNHSPSGVNAVANAYNRLVNGSDNKITGTNKATASNIVGLTATGAISIDAKSSDLSLEAKNGSASAYNAMGSGGTALDTKNSITGGNTATTNVAINLKAGTTLSMTGKNIHERVYVGFGNAYNSIHTSGTGNILNKISGNNTASGTNTISLTAGGAVSLNATGAPYCCSPGVSGGSFQVTVNQQVNAYAYNHLHVGIQDTVSGNNTATGTNGISITGTSVTLTAYNGLRVSGRVAFASAYNSVGGENNAITGVNKATAGGNLALNATAGALTLDGGINSVVVSASGNVVTHVQNRVDYGNNNKINGGNNVASASKNVGLTATGAISIKGNGAYIRAGAAEGTAYNYVPNGNATITGNQAATATNTVTIKSGSGITVEGGNNNVVEISADGGAHASGYNKVVTGGHDNTVTGNNTGAATVQISFTAPTITIHGANGINISGDSAEADAFNQVLGFTTISAAKIFANTNKVTGNNKATALVNVAMTATGDISLSADNDSIHISGEGQSGTASAYNHLQLGNGNTLTGANIASVSNTISLSAGGNITVAGNDGVDIFGGFANIAQASAYNVKNGSGDSNKLTGNNTATLTSSLSIKAGKAINIVATNGDVNIGASNSSARAYNNASSNGKKNTVTGVNKATSGTDVSLIAGTGLAISGRMVEVSAFDAQAFAYNNINGGSSNVAGGNNVAKSTNSLTLKAGTDIALTATSASRIITGSSSSGPHYDYRGLRVATGGSGSGTAYNGANGNKNTVTGNQSATGTVSVTITAGGDIAMTGGKVDISNGSSPDGNAYNFAQGSNNVVTGNHIARASNLVNITAGKAITLTADLAHGAVGSSGTVGTPGCSCGYVPPSPKWTLANTIVHIGAIGEASGSASNVAGGNKNKVTGNQDALTTTLLAINAGTGLTVSGQGGVSVSAGEAHASVYNLANGSANVVSGVSKGGGTNNVTIKTTAGNVSMTAKSGDVIMRASAGSSSGGPSSFNGAQASAKNGAFGNKNSVTGTNTATVGNGITITASGGAISLQGSRDIVIAGASAGAKASNSGAGASLDKVSGNNTAKATNGVSFTAAKDITVKAGSAAGNSVSILASGAAEARALNIADGNNAALTATTVTGNNTASANNNVSFTTPGNITVAANTVLLQGRQANGSAYNQHQGNFNKISGNNTATAGVAVSLNATKALSLSALGGDLAIRGNDTADAHASNGVSDSNHNNTTTGNNVGTGTNDITLKAGTALALSGNNVDIDGHFAEASAQQYVRSLADNSGSGSANSNALTGNNTATARNAISITAGTGGISVTGINSVTIDANGQARSLATRTAGNSHSFSFTVSCGSSCTTNSFGTHHLYANKNTLSGTQIANATNSITLSTTGDISVAATGNARLAGQSASALAHNDIGSVGTGNKLTGTNTATANTLVTLSASGNINIAAKAALTVDASSGANAYAYQNAQSGSNTLLAANTATANNTVNLKTSKNINLIGNTGVTIAAEGGQARASANSGFASNTLGADVASADSSVTIAGGNLSLAATSGNVHIVNAANTQYHADAIGAGKNTATFNSKTTLTATGAVDISGNNIDVAYAYYKGIANASGSAASAVNTATVNGDVTITGASVALSANAGNASIEASSAVSAVAKGVGKSTATAQANANITASGALNVFANGGNVLVAGVGDGYINRAIASADSAAAIAKASAKSDVTLKGATVIMATSGNLTLGSILPAVGTNMAVANGVGTNKTATATNDIRVQAGKLNLSANNITIQGGSAVMAGANATAEANTLVYTTTGNITTNAGGNLALIAGVGKFSAAGIAATTSLTLAIANDVSIYGGGSDFKVVNGAYTRTIIDSGWRYATAGTPAVSPAGTGIVAPFTGPSVPFGVTGDYVLSTTPSPTDPVAFIQIK